MEPGGGKDGGNEVSVAEVVIFLFTAMSSTAVRYFVARGKVQKVMFRQVRSTPNSLDWP